MNKSVRGCLFALVVSLPISAANAAILSVGGMTTLADGAAVPTGTLASDGYIFYSATGVTGFPPNGTPGNDINAVPSYYGLTTNVNNRFEGGTYNFGSYNYSNLSIAGNGGSKETGVAFQGNNQPGPLLLATLTLGAGVPANFRIGLLGNNSETNTNHTQYTALDTISLSTVTVNNSGPAIQRNDFYFINVSGAVAGDIIEIRGFAPQTSPQLGTATLGGITFDIVPEPSSVAMISCGMLALLRLRRRR